MVLGLEIQLGGGEKAWAVRRVPQRSNRKKSEEVWELGFVGSSARTLLGSLAWCVACRQVGTVVALTGRLGSSGGVGSVGNEW